MSERYESPVLEVTPGMQPFWSAAKRHELVLHRCDACGRCHFPATDHCNGCLATSLTWTAASGCGIIFSYVVMHHVYRAEFAERVPYSVVDVKLREGPHMITSLVECEPSRVEIGSEVRVVFEHANDEITLPRFRRV